MSESPQLYSQLENLLAWRFQLKRYRLSPQQKLIASKGGYQQAVRKGRGMAFLEVREYTPGDEIRHIDWKVSARTQKPHTKVFAEELETPVICVIEQTPPLFFGSNVRFKADQALNLMAILGWISLHSVDRFGGAVFNHLTHQWLEPKHQLKTLMYFLQQAIDLQSQLNSPGQSQSTHWTTQLAQCQKRLRPGSRLILIGDFIHQPPNFIQQLRQLKKHTDITLIHISDPIEKHLPDQGVLTLSNGNTLLHLNSSDPKQRQAYALSYQNAWQGLQQQLQPLHIPLVDISTDQDPLQGLIAQGVVHR